MKKSLTAILFFTILLYSCTKVNNSYTVTNISLMPLKTGNTWIYQDSVFNSTGSLSTAYADTATITSKKTTISGYTFYGINNPSGYFGDSSLLAYDSINYAIYQLDSTNASSAYVFFQIAPYDNDLLGIGTDYSNPNCIGTYYTYGFISTFNVYGYTCYKNIDVEKDCNGNIISEDVYYVSPGIGIVRIESYLPVSTGSSNLYLDFSQTLKSYKLN